LIALISVAAACSPRPEEGEFRIVDGQVVTDVFEVTAVPADGGTLRIGLDTDLGNSTQLMVSVSRAYFETGDESEHVIDYFSEPGTVGEWRDARTILISDEDWGRRLGDQQSNMAGIGLGFTVERIAGEVEVRFEVPIGQDPPFEEENSNLTGSAVYGDDLRNVGDQVSVPLPYTGEAP
jgi:hypothetical protein